MNNLKRLTTLLVVVFVVGSAVAGPAPTNFFFPHERIFRSETWEGSSLKLGAAVEDGSSRTSFNFSEEKVPLLGIYNFSESGIAMLMGSTPGTPTYNLANSLLASLGPATDDGFRGRFVLNGKYEQTQLTIFARYRLPGLLLGGHLEIGAYVPFRSIDITEVEWCDQTRDNVKADRLVKEKITNNIDQLVMDLGCLKIRDFEESGLGDVVALLRWQRDYKQEKDHLTNVRFHWYAGVSIPTAEARDVDHALSVPLGNDGAWLIPLGVGLDLDFTEKLRAGAEVQFQRLFDETNEYRMKTDEHQTDFLLLNKGKATRRYGPLWRFTLYTQLSNLIQGVSTSMAYQFTKKDQDTLFPQTNDFIHSVVNSAQSLKEWNCHSLTFQANIDAAAVSKTWWIKPQISFYYKLPLVGRRYFYSDNFGGQVVLSF